MRDLATLLSLRAGIVVLFASTAIDAQEVQWPYNLPRDVKYFPEHEPQIKRDLEIQQRLSWQQAAGLRKMSSEDEGEKFYLDYWDFGVQDNGLGDVYGGFTWEEEDAQTGSNSSTIPDFLSPAIAPHTNHDRHHMRLFGRSIFARDFSCPADTTSCASIGSSLCCPTGQTCVSTSSGVGCCPSGETCGSAVGTCDTSQGYTSCPNSSNGGCCVPGAQCEGTGCVFYGTQTVTTTLPTSTVIPSTTQIPAQSSSDDATTTVVPVAPAATSVSVSGYTTTVTVTQSVSGQATTIIAPTTVMVTQSPSSVPSSTSSTSQAGLTCTTGFQSCPASLGGGCCPTDQICGTASLCLSPSDSTTTAAGAPIRPTSVSVGTSDSFVSAASAAPSTSTNEACPTGYYMCSAYYLGGCCRVGRNCDTTSCPTTDSTAVVSSGATVLVPNTAVTSDGSAAATTGSQGSCANGWTGCAASVAGGCCPAGLICGTASCTATASGQGNTAKEAPSSRANTMSCAWGFGIVALSSCLGMILL